MAKEFLDKAGTQVLATKIKENAQNADALATNILLQLNTLKGVAMTMYASESLLPSAIDFENGVVVAVGEIAWCVAEKTWHRVSAVNAETLAITWADYDPHIVSSDVSDLEQAVSGLEEDVGDLQNAKNDKITATDNSAALSDTTTIAGVSAGTNPVSVAVHALSKFWAYISGKLTGAISTVLTSNLTASRAVIANASGKLAVSDVTSTQLGYLSGATSNIQTQLNGKQASGNYKTTQSAVSDPTASGTTITAIDTISQNAQGVISATKKTIRSATTSQTGVVQLNNTLTSTSTAQALTAAQGKALNDKITTNQTDISTLKTQLGNATTIETYTGHSTGSGVTWREKPNVRIYGKIVQVSGMISSISNTDSDYVTVLSGLPAPAMEAEFASPSHAENSVALGMFLASNGTLRLYERRDTIYRVSFTYIKA